MTAKPSKRVLSRRTPKTPSNVKAALLKVLRAAGGELVSTRELKEKLGPEWKEAMAALRAEGYAIDEAIGSSNNRSFRLSQEQPPSPQYLTEPAPVAPTLASYDRRAVRMEMPVYLVRKLLQVPALPTEAQDILAEALAQTL